jgi:hypothetical protein
MAHKNNVRQVLTLREICAHRAARAVKDIPIGEPVEFDYKSRRGHLLIPE